MVLHVLLLGFKRLLCVGDGGTQYIVSGVLLTHYLVLQPYEWKKTKHLYPQPHTYNSPVRGGHWSTPSATNEEARASLASPSRVDLPDIFIFESG